MYHVDVHDLESWRSAARRLLAEGVAPHSVDFREPDGPQPLLDFAHANPVDRDEPVCSFGTSTVVHSFRVPKRFLDLAEAVAAHRDRSKWEVLYRVLWRLTHGERKLLETSIDDDVHRFRAMEKAVLIDAHKLKVLVRFRRIEHDGHEHYVAFHRPDHRVLRLTAPFFVRRFSVMQWAILTPDESVYWDGALLKFGPGVSAVAAPRHDDLEELWRTYYAATFNPARLNLRLMQREMPSRHGPTLPETGLIPGMIASAQTRVPTMLTDIEGSASSAREFLPAELDLDSLAAAARGCRGCELCARATQTVFGEGPHHARLMFVGEQPGDREDLAGRPFVGPAGQVLDEALAAVGIDRSEVYVTNAVKHFHWVPQGTRRLHAKPSARHLAACRPWLEAEIRALRPAMLVCLGTTAAGALLGPEFRITRQHGQVFSTRWAPWTMATYHPSALLRVADETTRSRMQEQLLYDLRRAAHHLRESPATQAD